ncbi:2-oxo-4-hydroxy-4-carboxy-5-ureidoimidazoline decarboxylase [Arthrobacter sp. GCM10027362]|uniref:2-oxo-4-hydroxy-4-carboxy-5-ureidoimidazoline decarboxylase n=1 Tax=Arthrobacter sp. GCM10027362 TaxID=3273379 RepID=UPI003639E80C
MDLNLFNAASAEEAAAVLRPCVDIQRWVEQIVRQRPFARIEDVVAAAERAAHPWSGEEIDGALAHHPRIGERAAGNSTEAGMSRSEQAGVDSSAETARRLRVGNEAYEDKFGRVFLIRAAGRSAEEILAELERRLGNSPEDELPVIAAQLREIAVLRLRGVLEA